jgi:hypothetical protein
VNATEHRKEAVRLLALADTDVSENWRFNTGEHKADILAAAQVHATLALVDTMRPDVRFHEATPPPADPGSAS